MECALKPEGNKLLKEIVIQDIENIETDWAKLVLKYMSTVNLDLNSIRTISINSIKNKIYDWDRIQS